MDGFHDVDFPLDLAFGASGGPVRRVDIVTLANGAEARNAPHRHSLRRYDAGIGIKGAGDIAKLIRFWEARAGRLHAFRFRDPFDHMSCDPPHAPSATDQVIGRGDGIATAFALIKTYGDGLGQYVRPIRLARDIAVAVNGQDAEFAFADGRIAFPTPPAPGAVVTAGYRFDVPVRFEGEGLDIAVEGFGAGEVVSIPLVEVRFGEDRT